MQVLVGNKCDMEENKRRVPYSQGQALADEFGIQFFETSAKNNIKVDEVCGGLLLYYRRRSPNSLYMCEADVLQSLSMIFTLMIHGWCRVHRSVLCCA